MKTFVLSNNKTSMVIKEGLPLSERYRKNKETGEKKFYPVGCLSTARASQNYFFLSKSFHELIEEKKLTSIDNMIFKQHNNIPSLLIAFPAPQDTSAFLIFDGYRRDQILFIDEAADEEESPCPYGYRPSMHYIVGANGEAHCSYCHEHGTIPTDQATATQVADAASVDKEIKSTNLVNKFFHDDQDTVYIYKENESIKVKPFLDGFGIHIEDGETVCFLLTKKDNINGKEVERQYYVRFTYNADSVPSVSLELMHKRGMTKDQYFKIRNAAIEYENMLKHSQPISGNGYNFFFPDDEAESSPFEKLKDIIKDDNE